MNLGDVEVDGWKTWILPRDVAELLESELAEVADHQRAVTADVRAAEQESGHQVFAIELNGPLEHGNTLVVFLLLIQNEPQIVVVAGLAGFERDGFVQM